ncbi:hypothetical protein PR202_gb10638 [Eleusine coracana subsp. coracana]|uniref:BZIP domain-containing protein n=1 Tax=Eleusine coracana subsp. coracana TaxID=191504 RepID=A0AAV5EI49_ELECO|nr:hypothetical protein PR202_gb10638 [Eleusine coracana subsp. coracana]
MERVFSGEESPTSAAPRVPPQPQNAPATGAGGTVGGEEADGGGRHEQVPVGVVLPEISWRRAVLDSPGPSTGGGGDWVGVDAVETKPPVGAPGAASSSVVDPVEYNAMLKQKLEKDLAAVAMWRRCGTLLRCFRVRRGYKTANSYVYVICDVMVALAVSIEMRNSASSVMPPERPAASSTLPNVEVSRAAPLNPIGGNGISVQSKPVGGPTTGLGPQVVQNADVLVKQTTSSSSREQSDDDDMEGEAETTGNANPVQQRLQRRKQSNRESARRSRSRKAAHLNELEAQVAQLRVENSSLLRRLADVNQKFNDAAVDNRVLKADVETLRAKVKMAEDSVKRVTGMNPLFPAVSDMSSLSMPFQGSPSDSTSDAAVPIQDDPNSYFATPSEVGANNSYMPDIASSNSRG